MKVSQARVPWNKNRIKQVENRSVLNTLYMLVPESMHNNQLLFAQHLSLRNKRNPTTTSELNLLNSYSKTFGNFWIFIVRMSH